MLSGNVIDLCPVVVLPLGDNLTEHQKAACPSICAEVAADVVAVGPANCEMSEAVDLIASTAPAPIRIGIRTGNNDHAQQQWDVKNLNQQILLSQKRRLFLRETLQKGVFTDWDYVPVDQQEKHSLRADHVYGNWAYSNMLGYQVPEE